MQDHLKRLANLPLDRLRIEWRREYRTEPPTGLSRDLLLRATAFKMQERQQGGLSQQAKRTLRSIAARTGTEDMLSTERIAPTLTPGVRLVRDWGGQAHTVLVLEDGLEYRGQRYRSLTEVARQITGAHWSGPRFFGLTARRIAGRRTAGRPASVDRAHAAPVKDDADGTP